MNTETNFASLPLPLNPFSATVLLEVANAMRLFPMGSLHRTEGVHNWCMQADVQETARRNGWLVHCLARHLTGDGGDLCAEDVQANEEALKNGWRVFSTYTHKAEDGGETRIYIITEGDRSVTTILFPDEY
jgi:hypothetical protein